MPKTILITGATDGIGLETAKMLFAKGHDVLLHGRNAVKMEQTERTLNAFSGTGGNIESYIADLSRPGEVGQFAEAVVRRHARLDVLINNAGILSTREPRTQEGLDVRFAVNAIAPYLLTRRLLPLLDVAGRVVNLSSAAQLPVDIDALTGKTSLSDDMTAYAQSKLALTVWSRWLALSTSRAPVIIAINPGSRLGSKMVREGFGVAGRDIGIGAKILVRASLDEEFSDANGKYFDNDTGRFDSPHPDALDSLKCREITRVIEEIMLRRSSCLRHPPSRPSC